jgi:hypothetical protein
MEERPRFISWHQKVARVINERLHWASTYALCDLLDGEEYAVQDGAIRVAFYGAPDSFDRNWTIEGGCHHGSHIFCDPWTVRVSSCGGHWVEARRVGSNDVRFMTDRRESDQSWGDSFSAGDPYGDTPAEELRTCGFTDATGAALEYHRTQQLEKAFNEVLMETA